MYITYCLHRPYYVFFSFTESIYLDGYPDFEDIKPKYSESDSEDNVPLMEFKTEAEEELESRDTQSQYYLVNHICPVPMNRKRFVLLTDGYF